MVEPVEYERDGLWVKLKTKPQHDSGFSVSEVWVHLDRVDAVSGAGLEEEASWVQAGNETHRVAGEPAAIIRALALAQQEFFQEGMES